MKLFFKTGKSPANSPDYGFKEIKEIIRRNTLKSVAATAFAVCAAMGGLTAFSDDGESVKLTREQTGPVILMNPDDLKIEGDETPGSDIIERLLPPPPEEFGSVTVSGQAVATDDAIDAPDFAEFKDMEHTTSRQGELSPELNPEIFSPDGEYRAPVYMPAPPEEIIGDKEEFVSVEEEAKFDPVELASNVVYPDLAIKNGIQGKVLLSVYIDKTGKPIRIEVESSKSDALSKAAVEAIKRTTFIAAHNDGHNVGMWLQIPIDFKFK